MRGGRLLLREGWPSRRNAEIDHGAYAFLLRRFSSEQVNDAIESLIGEASHLPKASEIANRVLKLFPESRPDVSATVAAKRAELDRFCAEEDARRLRELDEWAAKNPDLLLAAGGRILKRMED